MGSIKRVNGRKKRPKSGLRHHKRSVIAISGTIILLGAVILAGGFGLRKTNSAYKTQETELQAQIDEEQERSKEIDELKEYVATDSYVEAVAKEKLGLVHENEILFKSEQ